MGVDLAEVQRVRAAIERRGQRILLRLFTARERAYCERARNRYERYAGRFAAKEAACAGWIWKWCGSPADVP